MARVHLKTNILQGETHKKNRNNNKYISLARPAAMRKPAGKMGWNSQEGVGCHSGWGFREVTQGVTCELTGRPPDLRYLGACSRPALETWPLRSDPATSMESTPDF